MSEGCLGKGGGCLWVFEWYSWKYMVMGFVWGVSGPDNLGPPSLQYGTITLLWHTPERHNFFDHTKTSKYPNVRIKG